MIMIHMPHDPYKHTIPKTKTQPLMERKSLPRRWNNKTKMQVLNANNKPPNTQQTNLQERETTQGREEAQERKKLERHNEDKETMQRQSSYETREQYK